MTSNNCGASFRLLLVSTMIFCPTAMAQETLFVDTYATSTSPEFLLPPVVTTDSLEAGVEYEITVEGAVSATSPADYTGRPPGCGGETEPSATYPSPVGFMDGPVGSDGLYIFALPTSFCGFIAVPGQIPDNNLQLHISLDGGASFSAISELAPSLPYNAAHVYEFSVTGQGLPARLSYKDDFPSNNYGQLRVSIEPVIEPPRGPLSTAVPTMPFYLTLALISLLGLSGMAQLRNKRE